MKNIIKEGIIMILVLIVLILIAGILFYDYVPTGKVIPNNVNYKIPEEIAKELEEYNLEENAPLNVVYEVSASDLTGYEKGKVNPFTSIIVKNEDTKNNEADKKETSANDNSVASTNLSETTTNNNDTTNEEVSKGSFFDNGTTK